jgi:hypothetical protein
VKLVSAVLEVGTVVDLPVSEQMYGCSVVPCSHSDRSKQTSLRRLDRYTNSNADQGRFRDHDIEGEEG